MVSRGAVAVALLATMALGGPAWTQTTERMPAWILGKPDDITVTVLEGPDLTSVDLGEPASDDATTTWHSEGGLVVMRRVSPREGARPRAHDIEFTFRNEGDARRLLDVTCSAPVNPPCTTWWDGSEQRPPAPPDFARGDIALRTPISAAFALPAVSSLSFPVGVALALDPHCLLSTYATGAGGKDLVTSIDLRTRIVLDPGQELTIPLVHYAFEVRAGYRGAVQRWHELFPDAFGVTPNTRPSLIGGGGYLFSRASTRELQWEEARRFGMGWEWAYCPAQTPGDWYADERFYNPEKGYAGDVDRHRNEVKGSLADYRRDMRERFHRGWWRTNIAFYLLPHAADLSVLERFPDGAIRDAAGNPTAILTGWIKPDAQTRMTYPWGNSYGQEVAREITQIAEDFQVSAIGFDEAYGALRQYGAGIEGEPGRAWDDEGHVYASTQIALARLAEHIHKQTVRGYTMATVMNKPTSYLTAARADVAIYEWAIWEKDDTVEPLRLLMGHKPMSWWGPLNAHEILQWQEMSSEEIREGVRGIYDFIRLMSLRWGAFPMNMQVWGVRNMVELMPVLSELLTEGWQADPAFTTDERLWIARYGRGVHSFLVVGNPTREIITPHIELQSTPTEGHLLFCDYDGASRVIKGMTFQAPDLARHEQYIARAAVQLLPATGSAGFPRAIEGRASMRLDGLNKGWLKAEWATSAAFDGIILARVPRTATPIRFLINGEEREFEALEGAVRWQGRVPAQCSLAVFWQPQVMVQATREQITNFPFVEGEEARATIVLPPEPDERDRYVAEHLSIYFDYWRRRQQRPSGPVSKLTEVPPGPRLAIVSQASARLEGPCIMLVQADRTTIVFRADTPALVLAGPDSRGREQAMLRLLEILDKRYPYYGAFPDHPMYEKAGLAGKALE